MMAYLKDKMSSRIICLSCYYTLSLKRHHFPGNIKLQDVLNTDPVLVLELMMNLDKEVSETLIRKKSRDNNIPSFFVDLKASFLILSFLLTYWGFSNALRLPHRRIFAKLLAHPMRNKLS